jgi:hypothetical protein
MAMGLPRRWAILAVAGPRRMIEKDKGTLVYAYHITAKGQSGYQLVTVDATTGALVANTHLAPTAHQPKMDTTKKKPGQ